MPLGYMNANGFKSHPYPPYFMHILSKKWPAFSRG